MIAVCPRCGSTDVHSSHTKGAVDRLARLFAFPPRRCSACGWRGYRFRAMYPSKHGSNGELPAAKAPETAPVPEAAPASAAAPAPAASPPLPEPARESGTKERGKHRHHRHHNQIKGKNAAWKIALLAVGLGAALGYVVLGMGN